MLTVKTKKLLAGPARVAVRLALPLSARRGVHEWVNRLVQNYRRANHARQAEGELRAAARAGMVPPQHMWTMVGADHGFFEHGRDAVQHLIRAAELTPRSKVLDVGCGLGKHAAHLAEFLRPPGRYEGFDIEPLSIRWCKLAIGKRHAHAHFRRISLHNKMYNPAGQVSASEFKFPYKTGVFDLVFLSSVFTHMFHDEVRTYLHEIARVLVPGGRCVASFFLLNDEKRAGIAAGAAAFTFSIRHCDSWIDCTDPPEGAVAHEEDEIWAMLAEAGLNVVEPREYGSWARMREHHQDTIVCVKPGRGH